MPPTIEVLSRAERERGVVDCTNLQPVACRRRATSAAVYVEARGREEQGVLEGRGADTGRVDLLSPHPDCESTCHHFVHSEGEA